MPPWYHSGATTQACRCWACCQVQRRQRRCSTISPHCLTNAASPPALWNTHRQMQITYYRFVYVYVHLHTNSSTRYASWQSQMCLYYSLLVCPVIMLDYFLYELFGTPLETSKHPDEFRIYPVMEQMVKMIWLYSNDDSPGFIITVWSGRCMLYFKKTTGGYNLHFYMLNVIQITHLGVQMIY